MTIAQAVKKWCSGDEFERVVAVWNAIPAEKRPAAHGAWAVLVAVDTAAMRHLDEEFARKVEEAPESLTDEDRRRITFWRAGHAHALLCAVRAYADAFCNGDVKEALGICGKMEEWFDGKGLRAKNRHRPLSLVYGEAMANHEAGVELERLMKDSFAATSAARR